MNPLISSQAWKMIIHLQFQKGMDKNAENDERDRMNSFLTSHKVKSWPLNQKDNKKSNQLNIPKPEDQQ